MMWGDESATENRHPLVLKDLCIAIAGRRLCGPLSLRVAPGAIVTLMGPSGSGKSSVLSHICGTLTAPFGATGEIYAGGREISGLAPQERRVGILFQDDLLFPHLSVGENLGFGLPPELPKATRAARIDAALAHADLADFADRDPGSLSGGQRARIACLRTLLAAPLALLLDEPFSKLDIALRDRFRRFVFDHAVERALPTLLVTHDPADADAAGGEVIHF